MKGWGQAHGNRALVFFSTLTLLFGWHNLWPVKNQCHSPVFRNKWKAKSEIVWLIQVCLQKDYWNKHGGTRSLLKYNCVSVVCTAVQCLISHRLLMWYLASPSCSCHGWQHPHQPPMPTQDTCSTSDIVSLVNVLQLFECLFVLFSLS